MGRCALGLIGGVTLLMWGSVMPPAHTAPASPTTWSPQEISRHIDALDHVRDTTAKTGELFRILVAIMSVPDAAVRHTLLDRLRPHFTPLNASGDASAATAAHD